VKSCQAKHSNMTDWAERGLSCFGLPAFVSLGNAEAVRLEPKVTAPLKCIILSNLVRFLGQRQS
jgi:hypothetical protein